MKRFVTGSVLVAIGCACSIPATAGAGESIPGRLVSVSLGAAVNPSLGHPSASPPGLLRVAPELQIGWGMRLAEQAFVFARLDLLGGMVPIFPSGYGLDLGVGWTTALRRRGWSPLVRFSAGGLTLESGGEIGLGPDYQAYGFRMGLEAGISRASRLGNGLVMWSLLAGAHATGLPHVEPCASSGGCSDLMIGPTVRAEVSLLF